jgi:hypothetical protein
LFADAEHKRMRRQINKIKGLSSSDYFSVNGTLLQARANAKSTWQRWLGRAACPGRESER